MEKRAQLLDRADFWLERAEGHHDRGEWREAETATQIAMGWLRQVEVEFHAG